MIVALHYGGTVTPFYGREILEILVGPALNELNAIIVAPDSIGRGWTNETNEAAVMEVLDGVIANYNVDTARVILTGFSMGGRGTWYIAGRNQSRFSAAIPIAGRPSDQADWKIPLYVIHSRDDERVPLEPTQEYVEQLKAEGCDVQLKVIEGVTHFETPRFAAPLSEAIPWIRKVWKK